jgi:hypothetical protein
MLYVYCNVGWLGFINIPLLNSEFFSGPCRNFEFSRRFVSVSWISTEFVSNLRLYISRTRNLAANTRMPVLKCPFNIPNIWASIMTILLNETNINHLKPHCIRCNCSDNCHKLIFSDEPISSEHLVILPMRQNGSLGTFLEFCTRTRV